MNSARHHMAQPREQEGNVIMMNPPNYEAGWVPGLAHDINQDESLTRGFRWLETAESQHDGVGGGRDVREADGRKRAATRTCGHAVGHRVAAIVSTPKSRAGAGDLASE